LGEGKNLTNNKRRSKMKNIILFTVMLMLLGCGKDKNAILHIKADITDAVVYVDGDKQKGVAPMDVFVSEGVHEIKVVSNKYTDCIFEQSLVIREFEEKDIYSKLSALFELEENKERAKTALKAIKDNMVFISGGTFQMGSNNGDDDEKPVHSVTVSDFYMCATEVTQSQWEAVMGNNPSHFKGSNLPVEQVSWNYIQEFLQKLNKMTGENYRLPTEAEWEYAARGGNKSKGYEYAGSNNVGEVAWYWKNSGDKELNGDWEIDKIIDNNCKTHPVGQKQPNELGLYDMSGNVWEWCNDLYAEDYYNNSPTNDPQGSNSGSYRVLRGGDSYYDSNLLRCSLRFSSDPSYSFNYFGFRVCSVLVK